jgi:hypothetical protein
MNEVKTEKQEEQKSLEGVKGWLLFFCISLVFITPYFTLYNKYYIREKFSPLFDYYTLFRTTWVIGTILSVALAVFSIYTGVGLWIKRKNAVNIVKKFLVFAAIYLIIESILPFVTALFTVGFSSTYTADTFSLMIAGIFRAILYFAIWYAYITNSKRVKATYHLGPEG